MTPKLEAIIMKKQTLLGIVLALSFAGTSQAWQQSAPGADDYFAPSKVDRESLQANHFHGVQIEKSYRVLPVQKLVAANENHAVQAKSAPVRDINVRQAAIGAQELSGKSVQVQYLQGSGSATRSPQEIELPRVLVESAPQAEIQQVPAQRVIKPTPVITQAPPEPVSRMPQQQYTAPPEDTPAQIIYDDPYGAETGRSQMSPFESRLAIEQAYDQRMQDRSDYFSPGGEPFARPGGRTSAFGISADQCCNEWENFSRCGGLKANPGNCGIKWLRSNDDCEQCNRIGCNDCRPRKPACGCGQCR